MDFESSQILIRGEQPTKLEYPQQMRDSVARFLLLISIALLSCGQVTVAGDRQEVAPEKTAAVQVLNLCILPSGKIVMRCKNNANKPVKAFKGNFVIFDDFDEASRSGDILFTSNTPVTGANALQGGYLIPSDSIIYLITDKNQRVAMVGRLASESFGSLEDAPAAWKKPFKAVITNVVFANPE